MSWFVGRSGLGSGPNLSALYEDSFRISISIRIPIVRSVKELVMYIFADTGICSYFLKRSSIQSTSTWVAGCDRSKPGKSAVSCSTEQVRRNRTRLTDSIMY